MRLLTAIIALLLAASSQAQTFEWVRPATINYSFNPSYPAFPLHYDKVNHAIIDSRIEIFDHIYGVDVLGTMFIEKRDTNGNVLWQYSVGPEVSVQRITTDQAGNIYVGGKFQDDMIMNGTDTMFHVQVSANNFNWFVLNLSPQGTLQWSRNLSPSYPQYDEVSALATDPQGNIHVGVTDFFDAKIIMLDNLGNDALNHTMFNGKRIGNISFHTDGSMYVSGSAEQGIFTLDTDTFFAPYAYNMFLARFRADGSPHWAYFGNDITFQEPMVVADRDGNAFFACMRFDTLSFNGFPIHAGPFIGDFFALKCDTNGTVAWGLMQPPLIIGPFGHIETGTNIFIDTDASGKFYLGGIQQGSVDWGNGVISNTGSTMARMTVVACIEPNGNTSWVKIGGSSGQNYLHSVSASPEGSVYFTGSFSDTATFDNVFIPTNNFYNFMVGKIRVIQTSLDDQITSENIFITPNPAAEFIHLRNVPAGTEVSIVDVTGRVVARLTTSASEEIIDVSNWSDGTYFVRCVKSNGTGIMAKVVKRGE